MRAALVASSRFVPWPNSQVIAGAQPGVRLRFGSCPEAIVFIVPLKMKSRTILMQILEAAVREIWMQLVFSLRHGVNNICPSGINIYKQMSAGARFSGIASNTIPQSLSFGLREIIQVTMQIHSPQDYSTNGHEQLRQA